MNGIIVDLDQEEAPGLSGDARASWLESAARSALVGSDVVASAASGEIPWFPQGGLYFLIFRALVCYVGQASCIGARIDAHLREGRPIERVAVILGVPMWARTELEYAYIRAWRPPWNSETARCGKLDAMPHLLRVAEGLDRSKVMPYRVPTVDAESIAWPSWRLQVRECLRD